MATWRAQIKHKYIKIHKKIRFPFFPLIFLGSKDQIWTYILEKYRYQPFNPLGDFVTKKLAIFDFQRNNMCPKFNVFCTQKILT